MPVYLHFALGLPLAQHSNWEDISDFSSLSSRQSCFTEKAKKLSRVTDLWLGWDLTFYNFDFIKNDVFVKSQMVSNSSASLVGKSRDYFNLIEYWDQVFTQNEQKVAFVQSHLGCQMICSSKELISWVVIILFITCK